MGVAIGNQGGIVPGDSLHGGLNGPDFIGLGVCGGKQYIIVVSHAGGNPRMQIKRSQPKVQRLFLVSCFSRGIVWRCRSGIILSDSVGAGFEKNTRRHEANPVSKGVVHMTLALESSVSNYTVFSITPSKSLYHAEFVCLLNKK
jgi:hypothetical protein